MELIIRFRNDLAIGVFVWIAFIASQGHRTQAAIVSFSDSDFVLNPTFCDVRTFSFSINIAGPIIPDASYSDPALNSVDYNVFGSLALGTPSGFDAFNSVRSIPGVESYTQGSSLSFAVSPAADLSDGLQVSKLSGSDPIFVFDGREVGTGRYHPALLQLNIGGTGSIHNSNNMGGVNMGSGELVDVDFGEEYITELSFNPATLTIATVTLPVPGHFGVCSLACLAMMTIMRRQKA